MHFCTHNFLCFKRNFFRSLVYYNVNWSLGIFWKKKKWVCLEMQFMLFVSSFISAQFGAQNWTQNEVATWTTVSVSACNDHTEIWKKNRPSYPQNKNIITSLKYPSPCKSLLFHSAKIKPALQIISQIIWIIKHNWHAKMH